MYADSGRLGVDEPDFSKTAGAAVVFAAANSIRAALLIAGVAGAD
jgi:hypothetical protein